MDKDLFLIITKDKYYENPILMKKNKLELCFVIYMDDDYNLTSIYEKREEIIEQFKEIIAAMKDEDKTEKVKKFTESLTDDFSNFSTIIIDKDDISISSLIEKNPFLKDKNIVYPTKFDVYEIDKIKKINKQYEGLKILYKIEGNEDYVTYDVTLKTYEEIDRYVSFIKSLKLSPLEIIMIAYDLVRNRKYTLETDEEKATESRDLSSSLLGEKIVCVGYSEILKCILKHLGIKIECVFLRAKESFEHNHLRNIVYVKDDKYQVEGIYYLDATWDSFIKNGKIFHYQYHHFLKTYTEMKEIERNSIPKTEFDYAVYNPEEFIGIMDKEEITIEDVRYGLDIEINCFTSLVFDKPVIPDYFNKDVQLDSCNIKQSLKRCLDLSKNKIDKETYVKLYEFVKTIERISGVISIPITKEDIYWVCKFSGWEKPTDYGENELLKLLNLEGNCV